MPTRGLEPPHLAAIDPKSIASASSATSACQGFAIIAELGGLRKLLGPIQLIGDPTPQYPTTGADCIPPILSTTSYPVIAPSSVSNLQWKLAVHGLLGVTQLHLHRCDEILSPVGYKTHSPCSQLHARLAEIIADPAGGLLPHRFTPYPSPITLSGADAGRASFLLRL